MALQILLIEDDLSFIVELRMMFEDLDVDIHAEQTEGGAIIYLTDNKPDLVILDNMLGNSESGPILAEKLSELEIPFVVVTSSKNETVFKNIAQYNPLAYYTKPLDSISLRYLISQISRDNTNGHVSNKEDKDHMFVKWKSDVVRIPYNDILYIEGEGNYITLNTLENKKYLIRKSLKMISQQVPEQSFLRIHRNFIINLFKISSYNIKENKVFIGDVVIPIGRTFKATFKSKIPL